MSSNPSNTSYALLVVPYLTKQMHRWMVSRRRDVMLRRVVTFQERYMAMWGPRIPDDTCGHMHRTKAAATRCRTQHNEVNK